MWTDEPSRWPVPDSQAGHTPGLGVNRETGKVERRCRSDAQLWPCEVERDRHGEATR